MEYKVVTQYRNDPLKGRGTGFSATLFEKISGENKGELPLSFRSTEFIDDAVRNSLTGQLEIKNLGWAFGQIAEMEAWYITLIAQGGRTNLGAPVPRNIITNFVCNYNGVEVFRAELFPSISANPYIQFTTVATESGTLEFKWSGDNGYSATETARISVA